MMNMIGKDAISFVESVQKLAIEARKELPDLGMTGPKGMPMTFLSSREEIGFLHYRDSWSRPRPREYRSGVRDRGYSPSLEPAPKRIRHDYYSENYYNHYAPYQPQQHRYISNFVRKV